MTDPYIPYARPTIENDDVASVVEVLQSGFVSQGPKAGELEMALARYCGAREAVVFSSGTAALMGAYAVGGLGPGYTFVTSPLTFPATASAGLWLGAVPLFADTQPETGNLDPEKAESRLLATTRAIVVVDFAGHPVDYDRLRGVAERRGMLLIADASHSLGAAYKGRRVGNLADMTVFSFHALKSITTGEGGAVLTDRADFAEALRRFRNHGMRATGDYYEIVAMGLNARLGDMQAALGLAQLKKIDRYVAKRTALAHRYIEKLAAEDRLQLPREDASVLSAWHLFVIRLRHATSEDRWSLVRRLRGAKIGVQVHYPVVYDHPYFRHLSPESSACSNAEAFAATCLSLPLFPGLDENMQDRVIDRLLDCLPAHASAGDGSAVQEH